MRSWVIIDEIPSCRFVIFNVIVKFCGGTKRDRTSSVDCGIVDRSIPRMVQPRANHRELNCGLDERSR